MSFSTLIGLLAGIIIITMAMSSGSSLNLFFNIPGLMIVVGGTLAATMIRFSMADSFAAIGVSFQAVKIRSETRDLSELIDLTEDLIRLSRKGGMLALENKAIDNVFYQDGVRMLVDGYDADLVQKTLKEKSSLFNEVADTSSGVFRAIGEAAPAFGMIGTLVGLIQMLAFLSDPETIGPAMAVALLTTLYGALIANLFALPMADKIESWAHDESYRQHMIIDAVNCIANGVNPAIMRDLLHSYLEAGASRKVEDA